MSNINALVSELLFEGAWSKVGRHIVKHKNHYLAGIAGLSAYGAAKSMSNVIRKQREEGKK